MPGRAVGRCKTCGGEQPLWELITCSVCGQTSCRKCATFAYGRHFCCTRCAEYFFHGDLEEDEEKHDEG